MYIYTTLHVAEWEWYYAGVSKNTSGSYTIPTCQLTQNYKKKYILSYFVIRVTEMTGNKNCRRSSTQHFCFRQLDVSQYHITFVQSNPSFSNSLPSVSLSITIYTFKFWEIIVQERTTCTIIEMFLLNNYIVLLVRDSVILEPSVEIY